MVTQSQVARVLLNDQKLGFMKNFQAIGIETVDERQVYVRREVILSADADGTPQLPMFSGVSSIEVLKRFELLPKIANHLVGQIIFDHVGVYTYWKLRNLEKNLAISLTFVQPNSSHTGGIP